MLAIIFSHIGHAGRQRHTEGADQPRERARALAAMSGVLEPGRSPVLDAAQVEVLRRYGTERDVAVGDVLFADGDETYDMFVMLDGTAEIVKGFGRPGATVIATYGQSQFLGEIGMLTGQRAYLTAVASSAGRVLAVPVGQLRVVMAHEPGLSDLILRTFLLRHSILM